MTRAIPALAGAVMLLLGCGDDLLGEGGGDALPTSGADLVEAPPPYRSPDGWIAQFIDVHDAHHALDLDLDAGAGTVASRLTFFQAAAGRPLVALEETPTSVRVDGVEAPTRVIDAAGGMRVIELDVEPGGHVLEVDAPLPSHLFDDVDPLRFNLNDFYAGYYTERFYVSNLLFDRYPVELAIRASQAGGVALQPYTNGEIVEGDPTGDDQFVIRYPAWFACAGPFLHLLPADRCVITNDAYESIDGRAIPVRVDRCDAIGDALIDRAHEVLASAEALWGPYPQSGLLIAYTVGQGYEMEYAGAVESDGSALAHEIRHQWFGRGFLPSSGQDEWIDEAMTSMPEDGSVNPTLPPMFALHPTNTLPVYDAAGPYKRGMYGGNLLFDPYDATILFRAYEYWAAERGDDFNDFLRDLVTRYRGERLTTERLRELLAAYMPERDDAFARFVYGP